LSKGRNFGGFKTGTVTQKKNGPCPGEGGLNQKGRLASEVNSILSYLERGLGKEKKKDKRIGSIVCQNFNWEEELTEGLDLFKEGDAKWTKATSLTKNTGGQSIN